MQGIFQGESKMAEIIRGKGVISGIAMGKIMLAGQNLDGYLVNYKPEDKATEKQKAQDALMAVAEILRESIEKLKSKDMKEQAAIMEAHRMMVQDPMMADNIMAKIEELGNAPQGVLKAAEEQAVMFEQMEDEYFAARAVDLRDVGKRVAKYILGVKEPEIGDEKVILCGREIEPSVIAGMETEKIAGVLLGSGSTTAHAVIIAKRAQSRRSSASTRKTASTASRMATTSSWTASAARSSSIRHLKTSPATTRRSRSRRNSPSTTLLSRTCRLSRRMVSRSISWPTSARTWTSTTR